MLVSADGGPTQEALPADEGSDVDGSWSPDGRRLAFGRLVSGGPEDNDITIQIANLETGQITPVPGSKGLFSPRWSPDGRYVAGLSANSLRLLLYDLASQQWRPLVERTYVGYPAWARDSASLFVTEDGRRVRYRIADGRREVVHSFEGLRQINRLLGPWVGQAPDDSILALRDTSLDEIFVLELE